jgi:hypothetical protein
MFNFYLPSSLPQRWLVYAVYHLALCWRETGWFGAGSKQGVFIVRSAYFMENQQREEEKGESSNKGEERKF